MNSLTARRPWLLILACGVLTGLPVWAQEGDRVAVVIEDEQIRTAIRDAVIDINGVTLSEAGADGADGGRLSADPAAAAQRARDLHEQGQARVLLVGGVKDLDERRSELGAVVRLQVELKIYSGRSGQVIRTVARPGKASAAGVKRAREQALERALAKVVADLTSELPAALAQAEELLLEIEILDVDAEEREAYGDRITAALDRAGLTVVSARLDIGREVLRVQARIPEGNQDQAELALRRAFKAGGLQDLLALEDSAGGKFTYRFQLQRRQLELVIQGVSGDARRTLGVELGDSLGATFGVRVLERSYREATSELVFRLSLVQSPMHLDAHVARDREGAFSLLQLVRLSETELWYRLQPAEGSLTVEFSGLDKEAFGQLQVRLVGLLEGLQGVDELSERSDVNIGSLTYEVTYRGRVHQLARALNGVQAQEGLPEFIRREPRPGVDLSYHARQAAEREVHVVVEQLTPADYRESGQPLVERLTATEGIRIQERRYEPAAERLVLICHTHGGAAALDDAVWRAAREIEGLSRLGGGWTGARELHYTLLSQTPSDRGVVLQVKGLAPLSYRTDGRQLIEALRAMEGVRQVEPSYDDSLWRLSVELRYKAAPFEFEQALWAALEGREFSRSFAAQSRQGNVVRLAFVETRGALSRVFVRIDGTDDPDLAAAARVLRDWLDTAVGVTKVDIDESEGQTLLSLWSKSPAYRLHDHVASQLAVDPALAALRVVGLEANVIAIRGKKQAAASGGSGSSAARRPGSGSVADLVERLDPSVVFIRVSLPDGTSWLGSGFFISSRGYILTNQHVAGAPSGVSQDDVKLSVKTLDGRWYEASYISGDANIDVALIKVPGGDFPAVEIGDSDTARTGESVLVIGNPLGLEHSVCTGIVSGLDRARARLQTDALINPGNSGGPVFDAEGRVIGLAVAGAVEYYASGETLVKVPYPGVNFIVPINHALPYLQIGGRGR